MKALFLGYSSGSFKGKEGDEIPLFKVYLATEMPDSNGNVKNLGFKAMEARYQRDLDLSALLPLDEVTVYFDRYGRVDYIVPVK